jgi:hypothetical protein
LEGCEKIDYSCLTILNDKKMVIKFGIIDYLMDYTMRKIAEQKLKTMVNGGE